MAAEDTKNRAAEPRTPVSPRPALRTVFFAYKNAMLKVEPRFKPNEIVGHGAYGIVW